MSPFFLLSHQYVNDGNISASTIKLYLPPLCIAVQAVFFLSVLGGDNQLFEEDLYSDDDNEEVSASIFEGQPAASPESQLSPSAAHRTFLHFTS